MTIYRRRVKVGPVSVVKELEAALAEAQAELLVLEEKEARASAVRDRWATTFHRLSGEAREKEQEIADITRTLDILAPEVDEYGIEKRERMQS